MRLAKTTRPSQAETLVRPRLFRRLDFARKKPVTWVWAPPGAGKTTLVASYLAARKTRGLWYQIDEGDADLATFFYYLGRAAPRGRRPLPLLTPEFFRDFLLSQALRVYSPSDCARIRRTAAGLLDEAGQIEPAARLLREAEDWNALEQLIRRHAQSLVTQGRVQTLEEWLGGIPAAVVDARPWLLFWRGWIAERHAARQRSLAQAFTAFRREGDAIGTLLAWAGVIFGFLSEGALVGMERWIALLDEMIRDAPAFPSTGVEARVATAMFAAITLRCPVTSEGGILGRAGHRASAATPGPIHEGDHRHHLVSLPAPGR